MNGFQRDAEAHEAEMDYLEGLPDENARLRAERDGAKGATESLVDDNMRLRAERDEARRISANWQESYGCAPRYGPATCSRRC